ncbi:MAG TPA: ABC transporter ATP-binding protein [Saprospiraceae bacterium]|nr:ABC transporter ATP-binding protein [Saprospiraceae bacterium]HMQ85479.1 ABC transporter ATP-binding protein [Saprospiraceae bacterium]
MLQSKDLYFNYHSQKTFHFPDLFCAPGTACLILGKSGSGKTTWLNLLAGLRKPEKGEIRIGDTAITQLSAAQLDRFRGRHIGMVFQQSHFVRALNVYENLALARQLAGLPANSGKIKSLLERLQIAHQVKTKTSRLSIGEQQRVAIARALINEPQLVLADEPTSALDDDNATQVIALLEEQAKAANATLVVVTHDARLKQHFEHQIVLA